MKVKLRLSDGQLGFEVLGWGLAALLAMQIAAPMVQRIGSRRMLQLALPLLAVSLLPIGFASSYPLLLAAGALYGFMFGLIDIGMNVQAALLEQQIGRPVLGRMHASWSIGTVVGGLLGALAAGLGADFTAAMLIFGLTGLPLAVIVGRGYLAVLPGSEPVAAGHSSPPTRNRLPTVVLVLGVITLCVFLAEGAVADWSGVFLHDQLNAADVVAALAYPLFEGVMAIVRLTCGRVVGRLPLRTVVVGCSIVTAVGCAVATTAGDQPIALTGFAMMAAGSALVAPLMISVAGALEPVIAASAIARVSTMGYTGLLIGPVAIGLVGNVSNLRVGFAAVILGCLCWALIGWFRFPRQDGGSTAVEHH